MTDAVCQCGKTRIALVGEPVLSATCYCNACRTAARGFERDLHAPPTVTADGAVDYNSWRKDRVQVAEGGENLKEFWLTPEAPTRRVVAMCCSSPMFADFQAGHWLSIFRGRLGPEAPKTTMRLMTKFKRDDGVLDDSIPSYKTWPPLFIFTLIASWAAMGFRKPKITW